MAEKFLNDIAKFGNNALTAMDSMQRQVRKWAVEQVDSAIKNQGLITQEALDLQNEVLNKRIAELEAKVAKLDGSAKPAAAKKTATKAPAKKKPVAKKATVKATVKAKPEAKKKAPLKKAS